MTTKFFLNARLAKLSLLAVVLFSCSQLWATDVTLTENFNASNASSNNYNCNSSLATDNIRAQFDYTWSSGTGTVFQNGIKLGGSSSTGSTTCSDILEDIPVGTIFTVKVYAAVWNTDAGQVSVTYNSDTQTDDAANSAITGTTYAYDADQFTNSVDFEFTRAAGEVDLTIASTKKRLLIDKIQVVYSDAPAVTYTVTWKSDGTTVHTDASVTSGSTVSTPSNPSVPSGCAGSTFMGWTATENYSNATTPPGDLFNGTSPAITAATTFHAVFADPD